MNGKYIFNKKKIVITMMISAMFVAVTISSAIGNPIIGNNDFEEKQNTDKSPQPQVRPFWTFFYKLFNNDWNFWSNPPDMYAIPEGNIGIGTNNPTEKLDVTGTVQMTGFKLPTGASNGYVLTSDESGVGSWVELPSGEGIGGNGTINYLPKFIGMTTIGNSILYELNNKIGIGTKSPDSKLEVDGIIHSRQGGFKFPDDTTQETAASGDGHSLDADDGSPTDVVYVNDEGNVGIGMTNPQEKLHIDGAVNATAFYGNGSGLTNIVTNSGRIHIIYEGDEFDSGTSGGGNDVGSKELNPIYASNLTGCNYLKIEITGWAKTKTYFERVGSVSVQIETRPIGGAYYTSMPYKTILLGKITDDNRPEMIIHSSSTIVWYHKLSNSEKTNGVQIKLYSQSSSGGGFTFAYFTNIQSVLTSI